ncbi:M20/M25/M40 family metallo-hydrolase [Candidatus Bathyarchaeota archaeon]|nr:M20/M25/M40 family metallo-hydrolase [Candidatus Bathyarchaeota archaeon]
MPADLLKEIEEEVTLLLSDLIRIDTTNPPGNETKAAKFIAEHFRKEGLEPEVIESTKGRGSVITRLKGTGEKPNLLLLSHLDVVGASPTEWSVDPFGGVIKDGFVWGRGALDMKGMTTIEMMTMKLLKRNNVRLKGDLIMAATADEEKGGVFGANFLLQKHPEKIYAKYVLNEGGGMAIPTKEKNIYTVQTSEKGILWLKVRAKGTPGHGSKPDSADNAIMRMSRVIEKFGNHRAEVLLVPTMKRFFREIINADSNLEQLSRILDDPELSDQILDKLGKTRDDLVEEIRPRIRMTATPTIIQGGVEENVIPSECEAVFDCRMLPGQTSGQTLKEMMGLLEETDLEKLKFEKIQVQEPSESSVDTPLYRVISTVTREFEPSCGVTPIMMTGGTDSRFFRKMGSTCYGFRPLCPDLPYGELAKMMHGVDERISIQNLVFGTSLLYEIVKRFLSQ